MPHRLYGYYAHGEITGWAGFTMALLAVFRGALAMFGSVTPDMIGPWFLLLGSCVLGGCSVWSAVYHRLLKSRLDGQQYTAIIAANLAAIAAGKEVPYPAFLPDPAVIQSPRRHP